MLYNIVDYNRKDAYFERPHFYQTDQTTEIKLDGSITSDYDANNSSNNLLHNKVYHYHLYQFYSYLKQNQLFYILHLHLVFVNKHIFL